MNRFDEAIELLEKVSDKSKDEDIKLLKDKIISGNKYHNELRKSNIPPYNI
jgi:hypothetical protein